MSFFSVLSSEWDISEDSGGNSSNALFGKALLSTKCCDCFSNLIFKFYNNGQQIIFLNLSNLARVGVFILKRPGPCGWLRPTQFKPRLDWVGSVAQVRRYCMDSVAQAFVHALAGCVQSSLQYALNGPRNSRSAHFAAHALDVFATHESPCLTQLIYLAAEWEMFTVILLVFWHWCLAVKAKLINIFFISYFWDRVNPLRPSDKYMCRLCMLFFA